MREFKYRAWLPGVRRIIADGLTISSDMISLEDGNLTELLEPDFQIEDDEVWDKENNVVMRVLCGEDWYWIARQYYELMQYTGLKDKIGKEIYEGDVLRDTEEPAHFQIKWVDEFAGFDFYRIEDGDYMSNFYDLKDLAITSIVIGNIYENPELVKK